MTKQEAVNALLAWWRSQIGYHEGDNNWNKYADIPGMTEWLGWYAQNQQWCDLSFDAGMLVCFGLENASKMTYQPIGQGSALCRQSAQYYKDNGAWYTEPQAGDQIFFFYDGAINHTGIVESVENGLVRTIEGNTSDMVARRSYSLNNGLNNGVIAGYGRPKWSVVADIDAGSLPASEDDRVAQQAPEKPISSYCAYTYAVQVNLLKKGCYGPQVANMQRLLRDHGFDPGEIDGKFGANTYEALESFQTAAGIQIDGEWGGESFSAMWNYK
jgi:hypothetical protein